MKLTAVPQLLLLTVAAVRGAPPLMANHERHGCSHSSAQSHPVEMKQSSLKETQFTLDFDDMKNLERDEKFEGDKLRNRYIGRDFGKDPYLSNQEHDGFEHHVEDRPNHTPCHMMHTDQSSNSRNGQGFPDMDHQSSLYKRDATPTTASPHLDVLNPVDKVYDSPVPELKGGVRRRAAEGPSLNTEEDQIKWVPPPEVMPVSEDYGDEHSTAEPRQNDDPKAENAQPQVVEDQSTPKKRYAVDTEQSPHGHFRDLRRIAKSNGETPKLMKSDEFAPRYGDVRRRRSEDAERSSHLPPKNTAETSEATASTSAPKKRSLDKEETSGNEDAHTTSAPKENNPRLKRAVEHEDDHKDTKEDTPVSSAPGVTEAARSEPKKAPRRRDVTHDETVTSSSDNVSSDEVSTTTAPKKKRSHVKRSTEHEETHEDAKEDTPVSSAPGVTEAATSEPKKARRRRDVTQDDTATSTSNNASSDEVSTTSAPKEKRSPVKRSTEHEETHKDAKEDTPVSSAPGVTEASTSGPKNARRRRYVENNDPITSSSGKESSDVSTSAPAPKENSSHVKRSTEHQEVHKDTKENVLESPAPGVKESEKSEPKKARRRRDVEHDETTTSSTGKASSDEGVTTSAPKKKRSTEHEQSHNDAKEDAPETSVPGVTESATSEPKKARKMRNVEHDETITSTSAKAIADEDASTSAPKEESPHAKRAPVPSAPEVTKSATPEPKKQRRQSVEDDETKTPSVPESSSPGVPESATSEPKRARGRRTVENDENATTSAPKENSPYMKRSPEHEEPHKEAKEDAVESTSPGVPESATPEPKRERGRRAVENDENATTSAPKENSPHMKRSPEHEEAHKEVKEDALESSSGVPESTTSEPKKARRRRSVEHDESATTSAPKENSPHVKRSPEYEEAHKEAKEDALESTSPGVPESATPEPKKARRRRSVEHDENATTSAPKENSPHVKRSPEHEESHNEAKEDALESTPPGVPESATPEPKKARRRRAVENDEKATTSAPKEDSPHVKRSPEHEEPHKGAKEDALESSAPGAPESATPEPKKARRKRAVENDENATTSAPKENSPYVKRSPEHEEAQKEAKEDVPEASSPGVTYSTTSEQKKEHNRRSVGDCSHTFFASKDNNGYVKRSVEHEGTHQDTTSPVTLKSETSEPPKEDTRRRRDTEHEKTTEANSKNLIRSSESVGTYQENREKRSEKDEMLAQHDTTEENVKEKATKEPILKREVSRRRRATEDSKHVKSKEEDAPEETRDSNTTAEPCEKKAKRDTEQEPTSAPNDEKKPDELQEHAPKPRVEALIMGGEGNCCKGRHSPGMHGNDLK